MVLSSEMAGVQGGRCSRWQVFEVAGIRGGRCLRWQVFEVAGV